MAAFVADPGRAGRTAGLGKGTLFRRFGTRAGIFQALLDDDGPSRSGFLDGHSPFASCPSPWICHLRQAQLCARLRRYRSFSDSPPHTPNRSS